MELSDFEDVETETDSDVNSVEGSDGDGIPDVAVSGMVEALAQGMSEDEKVFVIEASSIQEVAVSGIVEAVPQGMSEDEKTVVIEASTIQEGYKLCSVCKNNIRKIRFADHRTICGPKKMCQESLDGKVCKKMYVSERQHKAHCRLVEGKRHDEGTCERLYKVKPLKKWSCPSCKYWTRDKSLQKAHSESCKKKASICCPVSTCNKKFKSTKLMKAHLGNSNLHTDADRRGLSFNNKNKKIVGKRKVRVRADRQVVVRKKRRLVQKLSFVKQVLDRSGNNLNDAEAVNASVDEVLKDLRDGKIHIRKESIQLYIKQRAQLEAKYHANRYRLPGAGISPDSFLILKKDHIERCLYVIRRIPNVTAEFFFEYVSNKYPEWRIGDEYSEEDRAKRFFRFRNFLTSNVSGLNWNTGRPQDRDATTELLKARSVYYSHEDQIAHAKKFNLKDWKASLHFDQMAIDQNGGTAKRYGNMWGPKGEKHRGAQQESSAGKGGIGLTGFVCGTGVEF